ncbi:MAG: prephenate dehydrogenase/arogenate dehydrogenase family protein [Actinobacteria bacterium]|nr:prephenate dehydrogenase/arogenate dehydrogenase family protein [Actinomycetota bacterium]
MIVGIVGLGLIGGSLAKSIKERTSYRVLGFDIDDETMLKAKMSGAIDDELTSVSISQCDVLLLAISPRALIQYVKDHADRISSNTIVVDMCGVKRNVCSVLAPLAAEHGFIFVGGHPMAGTENAGFDNSSSHLFRNASMILTPGDAIGIGVLDGLKEFFLELGFSKIVFSSPEEHDRTISYTSQLAHIASSAFIKSPTALIHSGFSAGSFKDMTRVAKLDENMWTELFFDNPDFLTDELDLYIYNLTQYLNALKRRDPEEMCMLLREGRIQKAKTENE